MIKLSDYVMKFLAAKGVKHVFMLPGGGAMHLNDSLGRSKDLTYTCFLHEQALAIAAEAYGQHTNFPGVGLVTSGPGSTNAITAVAAAYIDSTPCVFISGQAKRSDLKKNSGVRQMGPQEVDIVSMVAEITKYAVTIMDPSEICFHLEKAWHEATSARKGPVWLDIPLDVQAALVEEETLKVFLPEPQEAETDEIRNSISRIISLLNSAERPLILAGNGVRLAGAEEKLRIFAERNEIPMLLTWKVIDFLDFDHPLNFGSPGILGSRAANFIVQNCDLLLILGSRLDSSLTAFNPAGFAPHAKKIMVDIDKAEICKIPSIDIPIVSDTGVFLEELKRRQSEIVPRGRSSWLSYCRKLKVKYPVILKEYYDLKEGINLYAFTDTLFKQLTADDIIAPESSGAAGEVTYQAIRIKKGQKIRNAAGLGAMGFGLPYAIGACIANNRKRTILVDGDGAFQLNVQELETVKRLKLPIKMFVFDNQGYGSIMATQRNMFNGFYVGSEPGSGLTLPDVTALAGAYKIRHEKVTHIRNLEKAIRRTLNGEDPALCCVRVSQKHVTAPKVQSMKLPDGNMISKPLEDMWPYLSANELAENMRMTTDD